MGRTKVCITLREDLLGGFKSRGLTNLSGVVEEFLEAFLSSLPPEYKRRSAKETRELAKRFLENRQAQENLLRELLQLLTSQLQQQKTYPPTQPEPTTQEPKQTNPQKPKQKNRRKTKQN